MRFQNILIVCIGNICRSPMAEYLIKHDFPQLNISSAGISALVDHPADEKAQHCLQKLNIDLSEHKAKQLTTEMLKNADLVLVMSNRQQQHIEKLWPFAKGKIFRLGHWRSENIADPYQHEQHFFDDICSQIQKCTADWGKNF